MEIHFSWGGKQYVVDGRASELDCILLPDGTLLYVASWSEGCPPQPGRLSRLCHLFTHVTPVEELAELLNAVVAREAAETS